MGIASLVLGVISIVLGVFGSGFNWAGAILGIVGIILGLQGMKQPDNTGIAKAGLVCSIVGTALSLILFLACVACVSSIATYGVFS